MRTIIGCAALLALAACNSEEPAEPAPVEAPVVEATPTLPAPDEELFAELYAEACPNAEPVNTSLCKSLGMGREGFACEFGLGDDEYLRNDAQLVPGDGKWNFAEPDKICAAGDAA